MEDDRPTANVVDEEEALEDAPPDWLKLVYNKDGSTHVMPFIPRRGEKDFEPVPLPSFSESTSTLPDSSTIISRHQQQQLAASRTALFTAISSGSLHQSSRSYNSFTWRPHFAEGRGRATSDLESSFGIHFSTIGKIGAESKVLELRAEEALYLKERGTIELWSETEHEGEKRRVPMSVQQTWMECIGKDDLTLERYQVYASLKRQGYIVTRFRDTDATQKDNLPPRLPKSTTAPSLLQLLRTSFLALRNALMRIALYPLELFRRNPVAVRTTRLVGALEGKVESLLQYGRWTAYDKLFRHLQIIPTGWSIPLPRLPLPHVPSVLNPLKRTSASSSEKPQPSYEEQPYQVFFNVYKPVGLYKKSDPPKPDFYVTVINAATTPLPNLFEFSQMFESLPIPPPSKPQPKPTTPAPKSSTPKASTPSSSKPSTPASSRPTTPAPPSSRPAPRPRPSPRQPTFLQRILPSIFSPSVQRKPSPYPPLKQGRRGVIVAVVDNGTTSFIRFGESEFGKLAWVGGGRDA